MNTDILCEALSDLDSGAAICLLGAGFSIGAKDGFGKAVPSVSDLEKEICDMIGISSEDGGNLAELAEYCLSDSALSPKLKELLIRRLTICTPSIDQKKILNVPWRSVFTTNFDDVIEQALGDKSFKVFTPSSIDQQIGEAMPVFYLHGRALDMHESGADPRLVISETNYLDIKQKNRDLYAKFLNEISCANRIFFIGYSLRDIEIATRLFNIDNSIRLKSIIITREGDNKIAVARLEKFGSVFPIGLENFAQRLPKHFKDSTQYLKENSPVFVNRITKSTPVADVSRDDVDRLILSGDFDSACFAAQLTSIENQQLYCINRVQKVDVIFEGIKNNINRFVVSSDIGNGKTTYLAQVQEKALSEGYDVFRIKTNLTEMFSELEHLLSKPTRTMFIIDDLIRHRQAAQFIGSRLNKLGVLVVSTRNILDGNEFYSLSKDLSGTIHEIDLNQLSRDELHQWDALLERYGYWEHRIALSEAQRFQFLDADCSAENRSIVLSIFSSSRISEKVSGIVDFFLEQKPEHTRAFVAILISALCQQHVEWEKVVQWLNVNETKLRADMREQPIFDFMSGSRDWHRFTSTQLADYIFKSHPFRDELVVDIYTSIVRETAHSANDPRSGFDAKENIKELMKYRFLIRLFGSGETARTSIESVYSRLSKIQRIRNNPQFWLQYAMSNMEINHLAAAEGYINTALGLANKRGADYSPEQILDQRVRLLLMKNSRKNGAPDPLEIQTTLTDLNKLIKNRGGSIVYPIRSSVYILELVDEKIDYISKPERQEFLKLLAIMKKTIGTGILERTRKGETNVLRDTIGKAILVLKNA